MAVYNNLDGTMKNELSIGKSNKVKFENSAGSLNIKTDNIVRLSVLNDGAVAIPGGEYFYVRGNVTTNGSVRYSSQTSGTILYEKRENGSWVEIPMSSVTGHNNLADLQGGTTDEYYHLSADKYDQVNGTTQLAVKDVFYVDLNRSESEIAIDTHAATGFVSNTDTTISFDNGTYIFSVSPTGVNFSFYNNGKKYTKTTTQTIDLSLISGWATNKLFFVYFNTSGVISAATSAWDIDSGNSPIATVFWNGTIGVVGDERHKASRGGTGWHKWAHNVIGTRWKSGLDGTFSSSSTTIASGTIYDEDAIINISPQTNLRIWHRAGVDTLTVNGLSATAAYIGGGLLKYDNAGVITSVTSGYFIKNFVYATNDIAYPIAVIIGQNEYTNINDTRVSAFPIQPTYISNELRLLYATVWKNDGGTPVFVEAIDYRSAPTQPNGGLAIRPIFLDELEDVSAPTPSLDQVLRWNGTNWTNGSAATSSASAGIEFFNASPTILAVGTNNSNIVNTLSKSPVITAEQSTATALTNNTVLSAAWLYDVALNRTTIDAGTWSFNSYARVSSINNGRVTTMSRGIYLVLPQDGAAHTVTMTGTGTSRTVASSGGTPFATTKITASATNTIASYLQTPLGLYQITARASNTSITITVPSTYVNESTVAFNVWSQLFIAVSPTVTSTGTTLALYSWNSTQPAFTLTLSHKFGAITFGTSNNNTTLTTTYDGTAHNTHFDTPLITLHGNLAGLQGGSADEYYHLTAAQYTNLTGQWVSSRPGPTSTGIKGQMFYEDGYEYNCVATNVWTRKCVETAGWTAG